jgi:hypothetical protein
MLAFSTYESGLQVPTLDEGVDEVVEVKWRWEDMDGLSREMGRKYWGMWMSDK